MTAFLSRLSHITFHVPTGTGLVSDLVDKFRFHLFAERVTARARQLALRKGAAVFLVNESDGEFLYDISPLHPVSTASNVCFEVQDVPTVSQSLQEWGCPLAIPPTDVTDSGGSVTYCVVRSVVGNISHTLLDCSRYRGAFLPGFRAMGDVPEGLRDPAEATHFDHITYACSRGSTQAVLDWYQHCFGFQRFIMNRQGDVAEGYRIHGHGMGLRLTAMRYRKGSEPRLVDDCKFVLAESLPEPGKNQVDAFLEQHGGAGIQHVGLYTTDIVSTARALAQAGVRFVEPPQAYYSEAGKAEEIRAAGQDPWLLSHHGILLDAERYLMQIFTKPIFPEETFFLELIKRRGAAGFGEGNIRALWRSVQRQKGQVQEAGCKEPPKTAQGTGELCCCQWLDLGRP
uniref:4-hydroxyphenylpyruvate dioxygenase n=1 Tax=Gopherus agassizii TaxID=38772 RepID=A0A452IWN5_9SAUR